MFASGEDSRRVHLEILVDGNPDNSLLDTGSEVTLILGNWVQELPKNSVTSQIRAANGTIIEVLGLVSLPAALRGTEVASKRCSIHPHRRDVTRY